MGAGADAGTGGGAATAAGTGAATGGARICCSATRAMGAGVSRTGAGVSAGAMLASGGAIVGAGTVLTAKQAHDAINAGAQFIVTPAVLADVADVCRTRDVPFLLGAFTPSEVLAAHALGSSMVKVFPASTGGPGHIKDLRGPFPHIGLVPSGGVTPANARSFLNAGAVALFAGSDLASAALVEAEQYDDICARAQEFRAAVSDL